MKTFEYKTIFCVGYSFYQAWFWFFGYGFAFRNIKNFPPTSIERSGYSKIYKFGCIGVLFIRPIIR